MEGGKQRLGNKNLISCSSYWHWYCILIPKGKSQPRIFLLMFQRKCRGIIVFKHFWSLSSKHWVCNPTQVLPTNLDQPLHLSLWPQLVRLFSCCNLTNTSRRLCGFNPLLSVSVSPSENAFITLRRTKWTGRVPGFVNSNERGMLTYLQHSSIPKFINSWNKYYLPIIMLTASFILAPLPTGPKKKDLFPNTSKAGTASSYNAYIYSGDILQLTSKWR